jgi:hypothetical protein
MGENKNDRVLHRKCEWLLGNFKTPYIVRQWHDTSNDEIVGLWLDDNHVLRKTKSKPLVVSSICGFGISTSWRAI